MIGVRVGANQRLRIVFQTGRSTHTVKIAHMDRVDLPTAVRGADDIALAVIHAQSIGPFRPDLD